MMNLEEQITEVKKQMDLTLLLMMQATILEIYY